RLWIGQSGNVRKSGFRVASERAACLSHLHEAQHSFVHAGSARSGNDDHGTALGSPIFNCARDSLANYRTHGRREKAEIHHGDRDLVAVKNSMTADYSIQKTCTFLIALEPIFIGDHSLETQDVY